MPFLIRLITLTSLLVVSACTQTEPVEPEQTENTTPATTTPAFQLGPDEKFPSLPEDELIRVVIWGDGFVKASSELIEFFGENKLTTISVNAALRTAPCDWEKDVKQTVEESQLDLAVLSFGEQSMSDCLGEVDNTEDYVNKYVQQINELIDLFVNDDVPVLLVGAPPVQFGSWPTPLDVKYEQLANEEPFVSYSNKPALSVAPSGKYEYVNECADWETETQGCRNGTIAVRSPDGIFFCPSPAAKETACPVYNAGAYRYAASILQLIREHRTS